MILCHMNRGCALSPVQLIFFCVCVCFTKVWVNYQILKLNGTEKFLVCIDHADLVKIRAYKHRYIVSTVKNNAGILLGASVQIDVQIKSAKIKYA